MTTPIIVGSILGGKVLQGFIFTTIFMKTKKRFKKVEVTQSWSVSQFLEDSKSVKR
jgi:hypothetical protein